VLKFMMSLSWFVFFSNAGTLLSSWFVLACFKAPPVLVVF
jgi:hypothetical protein